MKPKESNETALQIVPLKQIFSLLIKEHLAPDTKLKVSALTANEGNFCPERMK